MTNYHRKKDGLGSSTARATCQIMDTFSSPKANKVVACNFPEQFLLKPNRENAAKRNVITARHGVSSGRHLKR